MTVLVSELLLGIAICEYTKTRSLVFGLIMMNPGLIYVDRNILHRHAFSV